MSGEASPHGTDTGMNDRPGEQRIAEWLAEEAPGHLPDRVLRATFDQTAVMRQERVLLGSMTHRMSGVAGRRLQRVVIAAAALAAVVVVVLAGASRLDFRGGSAVGGPAVPPPTYESPRYHYVIGYPEGWSIREATRSIGPHEIPWADSIGVDTFRGPGEAATVIVVAEQVPAGTTLEQWKAVPSVCGTPSAEEPIGIGGEPGSLRTYATCFDLFHLWAVVMHDGSVYQVIWLNEPGTEASDRARFEDILGSFAFTD